MSLDRPEQFVAGKWFGQVLLRPDDPAACAVEQTVLLDNMITGMSRYNSLCLINAQV